MCGISGIINFDGKIVTTDAIKGMLDKIKHRGPDDDGIFLADSVGLGHNRLSIIALPSAGHQPFFSADKRYAMVYNGEIYNHVELREKLEDKYPFVSHSDTEVLLYAYIEWGEACLEQFNGMFSFAIYDSQEKTLFAARDRFGIKPFYYYHSDDTFVFGSEIPAVLSALSHKPKANQQSIFDFLVFNIPDQSEQTFFDGIVKLPPGGKLTIKNNKLSIKKWYDIRTRIANPLSGPQKFREIFSSSIGLRLRSDVPVGVCLSGGLDSSSIVSVLLHDHDKKDLHTFSAVYGKGNSGDESDFIDSLAPQLQNMHFTQPNAESLLADIDDFIKVQAEPVSATSVYAQYKVMELACKDVTVTLDGQGADEQLGGYLYFFGFYFKQLFKQFRWITLFKEILADFKMHKSLLGLKSFVYVMLPTSLQMKIKIKAKGGINKNFVGKYSPSCQSAENFFGGKDLQDALLRHVEYKLEHLLKWGDRNSMRFSVESRVPFMDHRLVESTLASASELILKGGVTKHVLREAVKDILPGKIGNRQDKMGFNTPDNDWFRQPDVQQLFTQTLGSDISRQRGVLDNDEVLRMYDRHLKGEIHIAADLWKWLNLEIWYKQFID